MELKITTLIEDMQASCGELVCEHGLSLYIEFEGKTILFDTGQTSKFLDNAKILEKDMGKVDYLILSHGHYDHTGGMVSTLETLNKNAKIYVGAEFFHPKYKEVTNQEYKEIGATFTEEVLTDSTFPYKKNEQDTLYLDEHIVLFKNFKMTNDFERLNKKFLVKRDEDNLIEDDFSDEQVLGFITSKGLVIVVGCSHIGICNILTEIKSRMNLPIVGLLGGTHLVASDGEKIYKTIKMMKEIGIEKVAVSHCTGELGMEMMAEAFGENFVRNNTGHVSSW